MGKVETNKKQKNTTLLQTSFELFTEKGFTKTTISDIVNRAGLAKGTFYLYFKHIKQASFLGMHIRL